MTLDEFLRQEHHPLLHSRAQLKEPGFSYLYVRYGCRYVKNELFKDVLEIATVEAAMPGRGAFKKLLAHVRTQYHHVHVFVENVSSPRFRGYLMQVGFMYLGPERSPCFFWKAAESKVSQFQESKGMQGLSTKTDEPITGEKGADYQEEIHAVLGRATES